MSLQRVKRETSSADFVLWQEYFATQHHPLKRFEQYLKAIRQELHNAHYEKQWSLEDASLFHVVAVGADKEKKTTEVSDEEKKRRIAASKARWGFVDKVYSDARRQRR
jgi:hypothetical protein